jgi:hypothetical protein
MKNSEIARPKFPFLVDERDYLSNSMKTNSNHSNLNDADKKVIFNKTDENSDQNRPFDLFAHILEG